jgi:hypothetical protein
MREVRKWRERKGLDSEVLLLLLMIAPPLSEYHSTQNPGDRAITLRLLYHM